MRALPDGVQLGGRRETARPRAPVALPLVATGRSLAVFEGKEGDAFVRLTYRREGKSLTAVLEKGREPARTYRFRKAR